MALSYFTEFENYALNEFYSKKLGGDEILITTRHGPWLVLSGEEYKLLRLNRIHEDPNLFNILQEKGFIITERNKERVIENYRKRFHQLFEGTNLHILTPTLRCNQKCIYCAANSRSIKAKGCDMDEDTANAVVDFIFQTPAKSITIEFQGGEPLINFPIVEYVIEYSKKLSAEKNKKVAYTLVSNFTLMDRDILNYLIKNNVILDTSLDGPSELHNKNRPYEGGKGSYDDVINWINVMRKHKEHTNLNALPTITKYSLAYPKEIVDEYLHHDLRSIRIRQLNNAGVAAKKWEKIAYSPQEFLDFWKEIVDYILNLNKKGIFMKEGFVEIVAKKILFPKGMNYTCFGAPCGAALVQSSYDYKGDIYTCDEARSFDIFKLGNVKVNSYRDIYTSKAALDMIALTSGENFPCSSCVWHPYCGPCLVCTYGQEGSLVPKLPLDNECQIRRGMLEYVFRKLIHSKEDRRIILNWMREEC